jgi:hypothetical protein
MVLFVIPKGLYEYKYARFDTGTPLWGGLLIFGDALPDAWVWST